MRYPNKLVVRQAAAHSQRLTVHLALDMYIGLKQLATLEGRSMSKLVRNAVEDTYSFVPKYPRKRHISVNTERAKP
jgi:hypothetical protein